MLGCCHVPVASNHVLFCNRCRGSSLPHTSTSSLSQALRCSATGSVSGNITSKIQKSCICVVLLFAGVKEAGWDPGDPSGTGVNLVMNNSILDATPNNLQHFMLMVVHQVQQQEDAWPFLHAVTLEEVPDYHDIIKVSPWLSVPDSAYACHCRMFISNRVTNLSLYQGAGCIAA